MKRALQIFLLLFGSTDIFIGMLHVIFGPSVIPGSVPVNATMDSEDRFYATLFLGYGAAILWCIKGIEQKTKVLDFLALIFFVGGIARLISWAAVGPPDPFFWAMTVLELLIPPGMVLAGRRIRSAASVVPNH